MPETLQVFVSPGCAGCRIARELVDSVRRLRPCQPVEVIDVGAVAAPPGLVGTPTYRLDDRIISLGNPTLEDLLATLDSCA